MGRARLLTSLIGSAGLEDRVSDLETNVAVLNAAMDAVDAAVAALDVRVAAAEGSIAAAVAAVSSVVNRPTIQTSIADNYSNVPIGQSLQSFWRAMHHVDWANVAVGDKFLVFVQGQVRSDWNFNVECLPMISWSAPPAALAHDLTGHNPLSFNTTNFVVAGNNVKQSENHYFAYQRTGVWVAGANYASVRFANNLRHRSSDPAIDGSGNQAMIVNTGQGGIAVMRLN